MHLFLHWLVPKKRFHAVSLNYTEMQLSETNDYQFAFGYNPKVESLQFFQITTPSLDQKVPSI